MKNSEFPVLRLVAHLELALQPWDDGDGRRSGDEPHEKARLIPLQSMLRVELQRLWDADPMNEWLRAVEAASGVFLVSSFSFFKTFFLLFFFLLSPELLFSLFYYLGFVISQTRR